MQRASQFEYHDAHIQLLDQVRRQKDLLNDMLQTQIIQATLNQWFRVGWLSGRLYALYMQMAHQLGNQAHRNNH